MVNREVLAWVVAHLKDMLEKGESDTMTVKDALRRAVMRALRSCGLRRVP